MWGLKGFSSWYILDSVSSANHETKRNETKRKTYHTPPAMELRSKITTSIPQSRIRLAAGSPAAPAPITATFDITGSIAASVCAERVRGGVKREGEVRAYDVNRRENPDPDPGSRDHAHFTESRNTNLFLFLLRFPFLPSISPRP